MASISHFFRGLTDTQMISDQSMISLPYNPSNCSSASYRDSSAMPNSPGTDGDPESYLAFDAEASEYRFFGPPKNKADELAYNTMNEDIINFG